MSIADTYNLDSDSPDEQDEPANNVERALVAHQRIAGCLEASAHEDAPHVAVGAVPDDGAAPRGAKRARGRPRGSTAHAMAARSIVERIDKENAPDFSKKVDHAKHAANRRWAQERAAAKAKLIASFALGKQTQESAIVQFIDATDRSVDVTQNVGQMALTNVQAMHMLVNGEMLSEQEGKLELTLLQKVSKKASVSSTASWMGKNSKTVRRALRRMALLYVAFKRYRVVVNIVELHKAAVEQSGVEVVPLHCINKYAYRAPAHSQSCF